MLSPLSRAVVESRCSSFVQVGCRSRDVLIQEGIWDTVRVDHGTEACLMLFVQNMLRNRRQNQTREPYIQTRSRE
ncbi:hypothetical protein QZH41_020493, partial [Actinostola sp. cb2023]